MNPLYANAMANVKHHDIAFAMSGDKKGERQPPCYPLPLSPCRLLGYGTTGVLAVTASASAAVELLIESTSACSAVGSEPAVMRV